MNMWGTKKICEKEECTNIRHIPSGNVYLVNKSIRAKVGQTWRTYVLYSAVDTGAVYARDIEDFGSFEEVEALKP